MRRPARLERAGALTPRDRIWAAIRCFGLRHSFSVAEVMLLAEQRDDTVLAYLRGLEQAGYVNGHQGAVPEQLSRRREFRRFHLVQDVGAHAPRVTAEGEPVEQGAGREAMWNIIRRAREDFSWRDLAYRASTRKHPIAGDEAQRYIQHLAKAGYLQVAKRPTYGTKGAPARYRFITSRNSGPRPPLVTKLKQVLDGNTGAVVYDPNLQPQGGEHDQ